MKVSWLAWKGKPALEFAAASSGARGGPKSPRVVGGRLRLRRRSFEYGVLRLPSVMKDELEPE
jgi:hypothetical protein